MQQAALADAGFADDQHHLSLSRARLRKVRLHRRELRTAARERRQALARRRLQARLQSRCADDAIGRDRRRIGLDDDSSLQLRVHERRDQPHALRGDENIVGAGNGRQPRRDLHRTPGDFVALGPCIQSSRNQSARVDSALQTNTRVRRLIAEVERRHPAEQIHRSAYGAQIVVFMRCRHAEQRHNLLAKRVIDETAVAAHHLHRRGCESAS